MAEASVLYEKSGSVAYITLNRPQVYNSFNRAMALLMQEYLSRAGDDAEVRCVVITGNGKAFSAGQDLVEATDPEGPPIETIVEEHYNPIITMIRELPKPVVAAVNGVAAGAGANIALACDIVLAVEHAAFIQAFSKIGLIPDSGGTFFLPRLVGLPRATALAFLGEKVTAGDAERMGMIYKSVGAGDFPEKTKALAEQLAAMPTKGLAMTKRLFNASMTNGMAEQLAMERDVQLDASRTSDYEEGVRAFLEKRAPHFTGQ